MGLAVKISRRWALNPDGTGDGRWPLGDKPPGTASAAWDNAALQNGLGAAIAQRTTGSPFSFDARQYLTGTAAATATISVETVSGDDAITEGWSIDGDDLEHPGSGTGSGFLKLGATVSGNTVYSLPLAWAWVSAAPTDTLAPTVPTGLTAEKGSGQVLLSWDASCDPHDGTAAGAGVKDYDVRLGAAVVATVSTNPGLSLALTETVIGSISPTPSSSQDDADWTLTCAGTGHQTATADQFLYRYAQVSGDVTLIAKINGFSSAFSQFSKAGFDIRESLDPGAKSVGYYLMESVQRAQMRSRVLTGGSGSNVQSGTDVPADAYFKLVRAGDLFSGYYSADGIAWTLVVETTNSMNASVYVGLFVASQSASNEVTAEFQQVNINNVGRVSYAHTTAVGGSYSIRARDLVTPTPNVSSYSGAVSQTPNVSSPQIKWHPGHYMLPNLVHSASTKMPTSYISDIAGESSVKGIQLKVYWALLEPTRGNYVFTELEQHLDALEAVGKRYVIQVMDRNFAGTSANGVLPAYLATEPGGAGGWHVKLINGVNRGVVARLWNQAVMDRLIALHTALAARFNDESHFEGIIFSESEVGFTQAQGPADFTYDALQAQYVRLYQAAPTLWTKTNVFTFINYFQTQERVRQLIEMAYQNRLGLGGPDIKVTEATLSWALNTLIGKRWNGSSWQYGGFDYRGQMPVGFAQQVLDPSGIQATPTNVYEAAVDEHAWSYQSSHIFWTRHGAAGATTEQAWTTGCLPFLRTHPNTISTPPDNYNGNVDTG